MNECVFGDCQNGYGKLIFYSQGGPDLNEHRYEGYFNDVEFHAKGVLICNDGIIKKGIWQDDKLQEN